MKAQTLEQVTWGHKCSLTSSIYIQHLGFCFGFGFMSYPFLPSRIWPSLEADGDSQSQSADRAPLMASRTTHGVSHLLVSSDK